MSEYEAGTFEDLLAIMRKLRAPGGCPWDAEQTLQSLRRYILEEANELVDAINDDDAREICEESGDVLLQVVFVATVAAELGLFGIGDVTRAICEKLITRHPHVFGDVTVNGASDVSRNWEMIKSGERRSRNEDSSAMAGIPKGLPALLRAYRIQEKAAKKGFDWPEGDITSVRGKVLEEIEEFRCEVENADEDKMKEELGDMLFAAVNLARHAGIDPEMALQDANVKFMRRFREVESICDKRGADMTRMALEELDDVWREAKELEKTNNRTAR
ncbi:nucleoside triphosphate pyrophosphohydrolase [Synergistales bacterium]|nr:nucleoside triphosphate pyrophosphohydrolase [Synergistales bacterium]